MPPRDFLPGARHGAIVRDGVHLPYSVLGSGPPLLLLHGHPQTRIAWRKVAPRLAPRFACVMPDLRGYGDAGTPEGGPAAYAKRQMAADAVAVMAAEGHGRFAVCGHDRGGRVAHRLAADHPDRVTRVAVLDIAPTAEMYARTDMAFARDYFWWFLLIQPAPLPERMIGADPEAFLRHHLAGQTRASPDAIEPDAIAEYLRCYTPATIRAICEDYRAAATIDLEHDAAGASIAAPVLALWGASGVVGRSYDVPATWRAVARDVRGRALPCGHAIPEEAPEALAAELEAFLDDAGAA